MAILSCDRDEIMIILFFYTKAELKLEYKNVLKIYKPDKNINE